MKNISFIIPAHNAEHVLRRAVQSVKRVAGQSDYELIIVENGSSDHTKEVLSKLTLENTHIVAASSETGVSNARNEGIRLATGKWIAFLDADDMLTEEAVRMIEDADVSGADLFCYGYLRSGQRHTVTEGQQDEKFEGISEIEKMRVRMLKNPTRYMQVWAKLFRRDIIVEHGILFDRDLRLAEDSDFTFRYTRFCRRVVLCNECAYHYSVNPDSVMRTGDGRKIFDYATAMEKIIRLCRKKNEPEDICEAVNEYILNHFNIAMVREVFTCTESTSYGKKRSQMFAACRIPVFQNAIRKAPSSIGNLRMLPAVLLKWGMPDVAALMFMARAKQNHLEEKRAGERS